MDIPYTSINVRRLLGEGQAKINEEKAVREQSLRGLLRAGSAGCIANGRVYGECHRIAHLRHMGVDKPVAPTRQLMFQAGEGNEDLWEQVLKRAWPGHLRRGVEVKQEFPWGVVLGSPDLVLEDESGTRQLILELKLVSATHSATLRELEGEPDPKHLVQAATYMWLAGTPGVLAYTSRTDFALMFYAKKYGLKKLDPFYRMFYLSFKEDTLWYRDEYSSQDIATCVTTQGIADYYKLVSEMGSGQLHDRPSNDHVNGALGGYDRCASQYCTFSEACERWQHNYHTWVDVAKRAASEPVD